MMSRPKRISLEVGYRLIPISRSWTQGGELLNRIKGARKKLSQELGFSGSTSIFGGTT